MADTLTTTTQVDPAVAIYYDRVLLMAAFPNLVYEQFATQKPLPEKSGNTAKFRRYSNLSPATTPMIDGAVPPGSQLSKTDLTARVSQYGDYVHITDVVSLTVEDDALNVATEKLGKQMAQTRDQLIRDILAACASSTNASGGSNGNTPTELTKADIEGIVKTLVGNDAEFYTPPILAGSGVGTSPIGEAFWGILSTALVDDIADVDGFVNAFEYPKQQNMMKGEWGATGRVRWVISSVGTYTTGSPTQYYLPILGKEAFALTDLQGATAQSIIKAYGSAGTADPLNQKATAGWKMMMVARILNDNFMHILKVTHS